MNRSLADRIVNAVLYEGYILYPYRPSVKNRQRWTFGGLYPAAYYRQTRGSESAENRTECIVRGNADTTIEVTVRFLHLTQRQVGEFLTPLKVWPEKDEDVPAFERVESLRCGNREFHTWQEAEEREVAVQKLNLGVLRDCSHRCVFVFDDRRWREPIAAEDGKYDGILLREQQSLAGEVDASVVALTEELFRLTVVVRNLTLLETPASRDDALMRTLVSAHTLLGVNGGEFISLVDPPTDYRDAANTCRSVGVWPALVGDPARADTMLASPIILYDYPRVAPESPGDLFDATEIDEILSLRILTLTDDEKRQAIAVDERARALLERTESLGAEELLGLHGTIRERSAQESSPHAERENRARGHDGL